MPTAGSYGGISSPEASFSVLTPTQVDAQNQPKHPPKDIFLDCSEYTEFRMSLLKKQAVLT